jgi:DHA3 family macrolide efflux protein-like MFS transporter
LHFFLGDIVTTTKVVSQPSWQRNVALFLVGQAITLFGTMITGYAISWYVTLQTQSGLMLTLFTIAMMVPMAIASPLGGVWADRYNRKYLINLVDAIIALVTLAMALFFSVGIEWLGLLFVCMLVRGFGQGIQMPTVTSILPDIVPADQLVRVNGFNSTIQSLSTFASPMVAAALLSFFPVQILMYVDVVTAAIGIAIVFFFVHTHKGWRRALAQAAIAEYAVEENAPQAGETACPLMAAAEAVAGEATAPENAGSAAEQAAPASTVAAVEQAAPAIAAVAAEEKPGFLHEFIAGLRYMRAHRFILMLIFMGLAFNILATPSALLTPLQVTRDFGADAWRLGAIEVVFSVGMMLGGVVIGIWGGFRNRIFTMALSTVGFGLGAVGLGLLDNFWFYLACMAFVGLIMPMFNAPVMGLMQERIDPDYMGRVFSVFMMAGSLSMPVAMLVFGPIADVIPVDWLLIVSGVGIVGIAVFMTLNRDLREAGKTGEGESES